MYDVFDMLANKQQSLSPREKSIIQSHPEKSKKLLTSISVKNNLWLSIVLQHHENSSGTGYPMKLKAPDILPEVYIYQIVDVYLSLIRVRAYRQQYTPREAIKKLKTTVTEKYSEAVEHLANILSAYPAGSMVVLKTGEIGVVIKPPKSNRQDCKVAVLLNNEKTIKEPIMRNTTQPDFAIAAATNTVLSATLRNECFYKLFTMNSD